MRGHRPSYGELAYVPGVNLSKAVTIWLVPAESRRAERLCRDLPVPWTRAAKRFFFGFFDLDCQQQTRMRSAIKTN
jgi:hypothetical protein